ncbi:MAG TPA: TylF/MycF/NovP-related O-methyltransferase [Xanthobacteraceae bacterium]|nr:TylF/MycF/NovP-related O-methyltransferase [Xanthobacteraceae bacterium]
MSIHLLGSMKTAIRRIVDRRFGARSASNLEKFRKIAPEISADEAAVLDRFAQFTMTGIERRWALVQAMLYLNDRAIAGDIVECGVWRGGNMLTAKALCQHSLMRRNFYLFDTFRGMSRPTEVDIDRYGTPASKWYEQSGKQAHNEWCYAGVEEVRENFRSNGLLDDSIIFVEGEVEDTLRDAANVPKEIALLRLDTDFYESTKAELEVLYPRLVSGGILIIDDYGYWQGARKATDEYFKDSRPLLIRIDYTARIMVKIATR